MEDIFDEKVGVPKPSKIKGPVGAGDGVALVRVNQEGYIPPGFSLRVRLDAMQFTANFTPKGISAVNDDERVLSVTTARTKLRNSSI